MAQITVYAQSSANWDATNLWNSAADGSGTAYTNPQNGANTFICDLNNKAISINVAVSVDKIRTGATNAGGTIAIPNSTAATITVATATTGFYSNYNGAPITWGTGTSSLTINGDAENNNTSTAGLLPVGTDQTITLNGKLTMLSSGYGAVGSGTGTLVIYNPTGTAIANGSGSARGISWGSTGNFTVTGSSTAAITGAALYPIYVSANTTGSAVNGGMDISGGVGIYVNSASAVVTYTGNPATSGTGFAMQTVLGTIVWAAGTYTLAASTDLQIVASGGTLDLTNVTLNNSGNFCLRKTATTTVTTTGFSVVQQTASAQAVGINQAITVVGPTLPTANQTVYTGSATYGYAGSLYDGNYYGPNLDSNPGVTDPDAVITTAHYGIANAVAGTAAGGSTKVIPLGDD